MRRELFAIALFVFLLVVSISYCFAVETQLTYDANGNFVTGDGYYRYYNSFNQLSKIYLGNNMSGVLLEDLTYDPVEERVFMKKTYNTSGVLIETVYYIDESYVQVINLSGTYNYTYVYANGELLAQDLNGVKTFFATDADGNIVAAMNSTGGLIETTVYSPYGDIVLGGSRSRKDYEAKEYDSLTKQTDFNARMYNPNLAQFVQPDTQIKNVYDPQSINRYAFERNNPYRYTDPTGHFIVGYQKGGEAAMGPGLGYATGTIYDVHGDLSYDQYTYTTQSFGGGWGGSFSFEGVFGPLTTAREFQGRGYTGQFAQGINPGISMGPSGSYNVPAGQNGQPLVDKSYVTGGVGGVAGVSGSQVFGGETNTKLTYVGSGRVGSGKTSIESNPAKNNPTSNAPTVTNSKSSTRSSTSSNSFTTTIQKAYSSVVNFFSSIFKRGK